ncbi:MAG: hypothetical protein AABZ30_11730 [Myxococcota bacterium]
MLSPRTATEPVARPVGRGASPSRAGAAAIWGFALGYFLCYAPYSALTKALSSGLLAGMDRRGISGFVLLPISTIASLFGMFTFLTAMGWWRYAGRRTILGARVPCPGRWTFLSGVCTAGIIGTTTLAYTFEGASIVFMMLLMRGGVLVLAPMVDVITGRRVRWFSWAGFALSFGSLLVAFSKKGGLAITVIAACDVALYLACYFVRLRFMSRLAKSDDPTANRRYFVEEQMVATPAIVTLLALLAIVGAGDIMRDVRQGFTTFLASGRVLETVLIGIFSQGTGIFGGLILLDKREHTFCVPVNRASSVLAGVVASYGLMAALGQRAPSKRELLGAALIGAALLVLSLPDALARRRAALAANAAG